MKQESIEERRARQKRGALRGVLIYAGIQVAVAAGLCTMCFVPDAPKVLVVCFLVLSALNVLSIIPALCVLKARFKEIEGGELDAAGQY